MNNMRKKNMRTIHKILLQVDRTYTALDIISIIQRNFGFKRETAQEYVKDMATSGMLRSIGGRKFRAVEDK